MRIPVFKTALFEGVTGLSVVGLTFTIGTAELSLILGGITTLMGVVVWLVRLEGRVNMIGQQIEQQKELLDKLDALLRSRRTNTHG